MANAASTGIDNGSTSRQKIVKWLAPSMRADSNMSLGSDDDVVVQQEDRERHGERGVGEPHRRRRAREVEVRDHGDRLVEQRQRQWAPPTNICSSGISATCSGTPAAPPCR